MTPDARFSMNQPLSLNERLCRAGQHIVRARLFFDLWFYFGGAETKPHIIETMREYNEFFRFTPHAYLVTYVVHIAAVFDKRRDTINLIRLAQEMKAARLIQGQTITEVDALLARAAPVISKVTILRHNAFAHLSASISYDAAFKKAKVTAVQLRDLTELALKIVNHLLLARGLKDEAFTSLPLEAAEAMMKALAAKTP
jgi:hypothetical protein